jgi:gamma-glutamyltranspeptidase/glutathione hydrolase
MQIGTTEKVWAEQVTARSNRGVTCAAAPLAAQFGAQILRDGGNAYDAVVSMALAETVLLPPKCGLGGDAVALVWDAGKSEPETLIAVGGASKALSSIATSGEWSDVGPNSVGPPAAAAGYAALAERAKFSREILAAPAIDLAENGFAWAAVCNDLSQQAKELVAKFNSSGSVYFPNGEPIATGELVRLPGLAEALRQFVIRGAVLLEGDVGIEIVRTVQQHGGQLTREDFAWAKAEWAPCISETLHGLDIWATSQPTFGITLLNAFKKTKDIRSAGSQYLAFIEANNEAKMSLGDISGTSIVSAVDSSGTAVVVIHSNSYPRFGSGLIVSKYDLVLANRSGRGFNTKPGHPNFPLEGRRPSTTLHAWAVSAQNDELRFVGGTPGGVNQVPWNLQSLSQIAVGEVDPGRIVTAPRWDWNPNGDTVRFEEGMSDEDSSALAATAPSSKRISSLAMRSAQQVIKYGVADNQSIVGAADPRTVGLALGV